MAIAHFAFGATLTVLAVTYLVPSAPYPRVVALLGGLWAMLPDAHWVSPVFAAELRAFHASSVADLFFLHRTLDVADPTDSRAFAAVLLGCLLVATALAERRSYRALAVADADPSGD
jgi:hypothetical protein